MMNLKIFKSKNPQFLYGLLAVLLFLNNVNEFSATNSFSKDIVYSSSMGQVVIDGKLDDWPEKLQKYPIDSPLISSQSYEKEDFSSFFMTGYSKKENALYLAVHIDDDEHIEGREDDNLNDIDTYLLYLDEQHLIKGSGISRYVFADHQKHIIDANVNWDPKMAKLSTWDNVIFESSIEGKRKVYEIKIILESPIYEGRTIGIGHLINDKDENDKELYAWNRMPSHIIARPVNLGTLVFQDDTKIGHFEGRISWQDSLVKDKNPRGVYAISRSNSKQWFYIPADKNTGDFEATIPVGDYILKGPKTFYLGGEGFLKVDTSKFVSFKIRADMVTPNVNLELQYLEEPDLTLPTNLLPELDDSESKAKLDYVIESYMDYYEIEGLSFAAFNGDEIYTKTYGVKNKYTGEIADEKTLFEAASITKTIFAYAVLRLYEKGLIDLDKALYEYLPFEKSSNQAYNKLLTARNILSHRSGLPNWAGSSDIKYLSKPGSTYTYSGEAFEYLKRVVEVIVDEDIHSILHKEVVEPLGLEKMYFKSDEKAIKDKAFGHLNALAIRKDMQTEVGVSHSLVTDAAALAKFVIALRDRKGLESETFDLMFSNQTNDIGSYKSNVWGYEEHLGLGFFIEEAPYAKVIRHGGSNGDFWCKFRLYDGLDMGYVIMTNGNSGRFITDNIERNLIDPKSFQEIDDKN